MSALAWEIEASAANARGDAALACVFKRAAHLAGESVARWQRTSGGPFNGSLSIIKNWFEPSLRWGYEGYSFLTNYNSLPASMLAAAFMYADDSIPECSAPADVGGFVIELPEHHLIIANAAGVYAEIETGADPNYEPAGLHRVHMDTCGIGAADACVRVNPLLVTSAGPPCGAVGEGGSGGPIAIAPWWATSRDAPGSRTLLSAMSYANVSSVVLTPSFSITANLVEFDLKWELDASGATVTQHYALSAAADGSAPMVAVTSSVALTGPSPATLTRFGMQLPAFGFDGRTNFTVALDEAARTSTVSAPAAPGFGSAVFAVTDTGHNVSLALGGEPAHVTRNGLMQQVIVETGFGTQAPSITVIIAGASPPAEPLADAA